MDGLTNFLGLKRQALEYFFVSLGEKPFRGSQTLKWIHQHGTSCFRDMNNLSRSLRDKLDARAEITAPEIILESLSQDGTRKWLLELQGGNRVETVFIPEQDRGTLCVSSQAGCPLDCRFCSTAKQGYARNLSTAEIVGQLWLAKRRLGELGHGLKSITNVVFMGMGEPLLNLDNVACAIDIMRDDLAYGLARRRITVSTAGIVPGIDRLKASCPVSLAVSLHAPNDALREQLVPINKRYPIADLLAACRRYIDGVDNGPKSPSNTSCWPGSMTPRSVPASWALYCAVFPLRLTSSRSICSPRRRTSAPPQRSSIAFERCCCDLD